MDLLTKILMFILMKLAFIGVIALLFFFGVLGSSDNNYEREYEDTEMLTHILPLSEPPAGYHWAEWMMPSFTSPNMPGVGSVGGLLPNGYRIFNPNIGHDFHFSGLFSTGVVLQLEETVRITGMRVRFDYVSSLADFDITIVDVGSWDLMTIDNNNMWIPLPGVIETNNLTFFFHPWLDIPSQWLPVYAGGLRIEISGYKLVSSELTARWVASFIGESLILYMLPLNIGDVIPTLSDTFELPSRRGFEFYGWQEIGGIEGEIIERDVVFVAVFRRIREFRLVFRSPYNFLFTDYWFQHTIQDFFEGEIISQDMIPTPPIPPHYTSFDRWESSCGLIMSAGAFYAPTVNQGIHTQIVVMYAVFVPQEYDVSFMDIDGRLIETVRTQGGKITEDLIPNAPNVDGRTFSHWFNNQFGVDGRIRGNVSFWAVYSQGSEPPITGEPSNSEGFYITWPMVAGGGVAVLVLILSLCIVFAVNDRLRNQKRGRR